MAEQKVWTVEDTRGLLRGEPVQAAQTQATPALPPDAVSATIETVVERPMQTTETVEIITSPLGAKRKAG